MFRIAVLTGLGALVLAIAGCAGNSATPASPVPAAASTLPAPATHAATTPATTQASLWTTIALPDGVEAKTALRGLFFLSDKIGWTCGDKGLCLATADGGKSWTTIELHSAAILRAVFFLDANNGWICGDGDPGAPANTGHTVFGTGRAQVCSNVFHTTDGGKTWKKRNLPTNFEITSIATDDGSILMLGNSGGENHLDGDIAMLKGPEGQKKFSADRAFRALFSVVALDAQHWVAVGSRVSVSFTPPPDDELYTHMMRRAIFSVDGGATWKLSSGSDGNVPLRALAHRPGLPLLAVGDKGTILLGDKQGAKWTKVDSTTDKPLRGVAWNSGATPDAAIAVAVGRAGAVLVSVDTGKTWTASPIQKSATFTGIAAAGDAFVAVTAEGTILRIDAKSLISKNPRP